MGQREGVTANLHDPGHQACVRRSSADNSNAGINNPAGHTGKSQLIRPCMYCSLSSKDLTYGTGALYINIPRTTWIVAYQEFARHDLPPIFSHNITPCPSKTSLTLVCCLRFHTLSIQPHQKGSIHNAFGPIRPADKIYNAKLSIGFTRQVRGRHYLLLCPLTWITN